MGDREVELVRVWVDFGQKVRDLRKARGWTQSDLAVQLGEVGVEMHQTTVAKLEGGTRPSAVHEVWPLAKLLDATYDDLRPAPGDRDPRMGYVAQQTQESATARRHAVLGLQNFFEHKAALLDALQSTWEALPHERSRVAQWARSQLGASSDPEWMVDEARAHMHGQKHGVTGGRRGDPYPFRNDKVSQLIAHDEKRLSRFLEEVEKYVEYQEKA